MYLLFTQQVVVFDFLKTLGGEAGNYIQFIKRATFTNPTQRLLAQVGNMINNFQI
ncbi:hypothetical protein [Runella salmonicolor]|uniref:Uncharacterized protein n=1 Tax=Runella salmonicolor TaxID=2950278 RepID=A0ABT1FXQ3_9BACT|nr:hypothetical protein [Runella salmonicolor]MCP1386486.1 hypothetical protein [Runella salmonicolor]